MFESLLYVVLTLLTIALILCLYRLLKGPSTADRVVALDAIGVNILALTAVTSIMLRTDAYFSIIMLIGLISFIGTVAFSKFIERGAIFERNRNR